VLELVPAEERAGMSVDEIRRRFEGKELRKEIETALSVLLSAGAGVASGDAEWRFREGRHLAVLRREGTTWRLADLR
jgi:hypothetical protein